MNIVNLNIVNLISPEQEWRSLNFSRSGAPAFGESGKKRESSAFGESGPAFGECPGGEAVRENGEVLFFDAARSAPPTTTHQK